MSYLWQTRDSAKAAVAKEEARVPKFDEKIGIQQVGVKLVVAHVVGTHLRTQCS